MSDQPPIRFNLVEGRFEFVDVDRVGEILRREGVLFSDKDTGLALDQLVRKVNALYQTADLERIEVKRTTPPVPAGSGRLKRLAYRLTYRLLRPVLDFMVDTWGRQMQFNAETTNALNQLVPVVMEALGRQQRFNQAATDLIFFLHKEREKLLDLAQYLDQRDEGLKLGLRRLDEWHQALTREFRETDEWHQALTREFRETTAGLQKQTENNGQEAEQARQRLGLLEKNMTWYRRRLDDLLVEFARTASPAERTAVADGTREKLADDAYFLFEELFRGAEPLVRERMAPYVEAFVGCTRVVDLGCGRGEFLEILRDAGIGARGIDANRRMIEVCAAKGLAVEQADLFEHLETTAPASFDGVYCAQVVEHFTCEQLHDFLRLVHRVLEPGGRVLIETQNVASVYSFLHNFCADWDHKTPILPKSLRHTVTEFGFEVLQLETRHPVPENERLEQLDGVGGAGKDALVEKLNRNFDRLNQFVYGDQDFFLLAQKPGNEHHE
jgi:2-polyprenyl-3-methyl-5-hydroxy-6-metoxy-1,4-benzoquinol methylase